ncbi:MAG: alanine dehydrogenase, partial [Sediminibacterium sp.]
QEIEPDEFLQKTFEYPVYVHLKGADLYQHKATKKYSRDDFHTHPQQYHCIFEPYCFEADILMNGVYWNEDIPRLFSMDTLKNPRFKMHTIADITDDRGGSVPCNIGDATIVNPVYGVDKNTGEKTAPYARNTVDIMAVGNLPNELPRDASRYFGEQLIKYVLDDIRKGGSPIIEGATILTNGKLTAPYLYLADYAAVD